MRVAVAITLTEKKGRRSSAGRRGGAWRPGWCCSNVNLRTRFLKMIARAGLEPWPKLFHNLRASRQTELLDDFPVKAVCEWLGNSQAVPGALCPVTDDHFRAAAGEPSGDGEAKSDAVAKQFPKQHAAAEPSTNPQSAKNCRCKPLAHKHFCEAMRIRATPRSPLQNASQWAVQDSNL